MTVLRRSARLARSLPMAWRYALAMLLVTAVLGVVSGVLLNKQVQDRTVRQAETVTVNIADLGFAPLLRPEDFDAPLGEVRRANLDLQTESLFRDGYVKRLKLFGPDRRIIWSDVSRIIGQKGEDEVVRAMRGEVVSDFTEIDGKPVLETYVPVRLPGSSEVVGVCEVYTPYGPALAQMTRDRNVLVALLVALLLALWFVLWRVAEASNRRLRQVARDREVEARTDSLTGLGNRRSFLEHVERAIAQGAAPSVLLLDLDGFKEVNDTFGHAVGDELLLAVAARLSEVVGANPTIARLGGDEFALSTEQPAEIAALLAHEIASAVSGRPFTIRGTRLLVMASIGVADAPSAGAAGHEGTPADRAQGLLRRADTAMYAAKRSSTAVVPWHPDLDEGLSDSLELAAELREGIADGQLRAYVQPIVDLRSGAVTGGELLCRWAHPTKGLLLPDRFIPLAERSDLIRDITTWALRTAAEAVAAWDESGLPLRIAVNLSGRDLDDTLPVRVTAALELAGAPADRIDVEVTESVIPRQLDEAAHVLDLLATVGVAASVDDFGTGYATLVWLRQLSFRTLKIDRSFIASVTSDPASLELVRHTVALGQGMGMRVVAEGVETEAHASVMRGLGCDAAQGYHYARPMPLADFVAWVRTQPVAAEAAVPSRS